MSNSFFRVGTEFFLVTYMGAVTFFAFFFQRILGFKSFSATPYVRIFAVLLVVLFFVHCLIRCKAKIPNAFSGGLGVLFLALFVLNFIWLAIGGTAEAHLLYLATDFFYVIIQFASFLLGYIYVYRLRANISPVSFYKALVILLVVSVILTGFGVRANYDLLIVSVIFVLWLGYCGRYKQLLFMLAILLLLLPYANRALILSVMFLLFLCFLAGGFASKLKFFFLSTGGLLLVVFLFQGTDYFSGSNFERRIDESIAFFLDAGESDLPLPIQQRFYEGEMVMSDAGQKGWVFPVIFGLGHGYTIDMTGSSDDSVISNQLVGASNTHNIHFMHFALLARFGVVGGFVYFLIFSVAVSRGYALIKTKNRSGLDCSAFVSNLFVAALFVFSLSASSFWFTSALLGFFCGVSEAKKTLNLTSRIS